MIGILVPVLAWAVASDSEGSSEEDWVERFAEIDRARTQDGVPRLTARERMGMLLGKPDPNSEFVVGVVWDHGIPAMALCLYRRVEAQFPTATRWALRCVLGPYIHGNSCEEDKVSLDRDAAQWGRILHLKIDLEAREGVEVFMTTWAHRMDHLK